MDRGEPDVEASSTTGNSAASGDMTLQDEFARMHGVWSRWWLRRAVWLEATYVLKTAAKNGVASSWVTPWMAEVLILSDGVLVATGEGCCIGLRRN